MAPKLFFMNRYSALIPVYKNDRLSYLKVAVESMLNQTKSFDEILLVVEGDVDNDIDSYLTSLADPVKVFRIKDQKGPLNFGLPATLNFGINNATGDYIVRLDSDDYSVTERLERIDVFLNKHTDLHLLSSWVEEYDEELEVLISTRKVPLSDGDIKKWGKWKNPFNGPAAVFKRNTALGLGGYPIVASNEDYCFWAEFMINGYSVGNIAEPLVKMRTGKSMIPRRKSKRYIMGTIQSNSYLFSIGYFSFHHFIWHTLVNSLFRRLPTRIFYLFQYKLFRYVQG